MNILSKFQLPGLGKILKALEEKAHSLTELINDGGDGKTAPLHQVCKLWIWILKNCYPEQVWII